MSLIDRFMVKVKRADTPFYRGLKKMGTWMLYGASVPVPRRLLPLFRALYELHFFVVITCRRLVVMFYRQPLFRGRCASVGKGLKMYGPMPFVSGHVEIHVGDDVTLYPPLSIHSGRFFEHPQLIIKDRVAVGRDVVISVNQEIVIEEDVIISPRCRISDSDGHARDAERRAKGEAMPASEIRPVRICRRAWLGTGSQVMKGVTIGEGAVIGANSVVISNIPPYSLAMGNPAEVYLKNFGRAKGSGA